MEMQEALCVIKDREYFKLLGVSDSTRRRFINNFSMKLCQNFKSEDPLLKILS